MSGNLLLLFQQRATSDAVQPRWRARKAHGFGMTSARLVRFASLAALRRAGWLSRQAARRSGLPRLRSLARILMTAPGRNEPSTAQVAPISAM